MAITLGTEVALAVHLDAALTYGDIETALVDAGFTSYTIMRQMNFDDSADVQIFVRNEPDGEGNIAPLPAADTLTNLSAAMTTLEGDEPS
jgi:hypothetical protein